MSKQNGRILALDPGTRYIGVAVLQNQKLIYHGVEIIDRKSSPHEALQEGRRVILRLIKDFRPSTLALERAYFAKHKGRHSSLLNVFVDEIMSIGKRKGLKVKGYAPSTVKKAVCGDGRAGKSEVARALISKFPELKVYLTQDRGWKERYHQHMFDAVAVGTITSEGGNRNDKIFYNSSS